MQRYLKKLKTEIPYAAGDSAFSSLWCVPRHLSERLKKKHSFEKLLAPFTIIAALIPIAKTRNPPKYPSTDDWRNKLHYSLCGTTTWEFKKR